MPTALVSKSSIGISAARSCDGCAAAWTINAGRIVLTVSAIACRSRTSTSWWWKSRERPLEAALIPTRVGRGAEEDGALIVVDAVDFAAARRQVLADL